jgi:hypothetical protein
MYAWIYVMGIFRCMNINHPVCRQKILQVRRFSAYSTDTEKSLDEKSGRSKTDSAMRPNMTNRFWLKHTQIALQSITHEQRRRFDSRRVAKKALALAFSGITSIYAGK